tara:strand:+ start:91 stop:1209 length:1119 start_codon:yes stop_codon:yes gene_type:complete
MGDLSVRVNGYSKEPSLFCDVSGCIVMPTEYPSSLKHLKTDAVGIPFEFLTISKIAENFGWIAGKPEPDRGGDILARNEGDASLRTVQVRARSTHTATASGFEDYRFTVSPAQLNDFTQNANNSCLICWMYHGNREPVAAIFPGKVIIDMTRGKQTEKEFKFPLYLNYEKGACRFGIKERLDKDQNDINDASDYLDNWDGYFSWNGPKITRTMRKNRVKKMVSAVGEMRTIFRILIGDDWTANKPYPDKTSDILALNVESGQFCPIQVKTARERTERMDGGEKFHYSITNLQQRKLIDDSKNSIYIFWIWDQNEEEPDDWTPIVIKEDELIENHRSVLTGNVNILRKDGQLFWHHNGEIPAKKWVNDWSYFD